MKQTILSILLMLLPMVVSADTFEIDGIKYWSVVPKAKEVAVISNLGNYSGDVIIPASVNYNDVRYSVTSIGNYAFKNCSALTSIVIPNSVTSIGDGAFSGCSGLTSVTIPNSVTSTGWASFENCSGLTSVVIPNSVTSIGDFSFQGCSALTSITIPNNVTTIGWASFSGCSGLTSITIPNSVTSIGRLAFSGCSGLTSISIPNSVSSIRIETFKGCSGLTSVTIGSGVKSIGDQVFANCDELIDVYCLTEQVPSTSLDAFKDSYPQYMILHVPAASIEDYHSRMPWNQFKAIVILEDDANPGIKKCAMPEISYANGKLDFTSETEGVEFVSEVTIKDAKKYYDASVTLSLTYKVTVYATKDGYEKSDIATKEIVITNNNTESAEVLTGDVNGDGVVNVSDHVKLSDIIMKSKGSLNGKK